MPAAAQFLPEAHSLDADKGLELNVYQCSGCGLVQLSNEPVSYYKEVIRAAGISPEMKEFRQQQFSAFVRKYSLQNKKILEVGCGQGEYLSIMQQAGVDAYGIEASASSVDVCNRNGLNVSQEYIEHADQRLNHAPFDAFFILNFLEHCPNPNSILM